jgi:hypothetical protein
MKKTTKEITEIKDASKSSGVSYSPKRQKKLKESSRYRPLSHVRKNLERGLECARVAL